MESRQSIEDLFAFANACKDLNYFIRNICTYEAGRIHNLITGDKGKRDKVDQFYLIPTAPESTWTDLLANDKLSSKSYRRIQRWHRKITNYYTENYFLYVQYKHGLTIGLRPFGQTWKQDFIQTLKPSHRYMLAFDNLGIEKIFKNKPRFRELLMFPMVPQTQPFMTQLQKEDNLLRFFPASHPRTAIRYIFSIVAATTTLLEVLISNLREWMLESNKDEKIKFWLPSARFLDYTCVTNLDPD